MKKIFSLFLTIYLLFFSGQAFCAEASLDEMIGQMIIVGFKGNSTVSRGFKNVIKELNNGKISGVIFFEDNIKNKQSLFNMTDIVYKSRMSARPFIAVDMEGGQVQRLNSKNGFEDFPSASKVAAMDIKQVQETYTNMAQTLAGNLFNLNFAPCVDLDLNENSILHKKERSYSSDPAKVALFANELINAHYDKAIVTVLKHFPGHGSVAADTHLNFADATETHTTAELLPYKNLMFKNNLIMVMVSHVFNKNYDEIYPASLSYNTIGWILRSELGFDGVVITDDLDMGAIKHNYDLEETVIQAINAGNDILLFSNRHPYNPNLVDDINKIIKNAIVEGLIKPDRIQESYDRIIKLKKAIIAAEKK